MVSSMDKIIFLLTVFAIATAPTALLVKPKGFMLAVKIVSILLFSASMYLLLRQ